MHLLQRCMPNMMCCFGMPDSDASHQPAALRRLPNNASTISMTMPANSVPDAASTQTDLQRIFASNATPGGYHAASKGTSKRLLPHGSLDLSFQFGTPSNDKRPSRGTNQVAGHIKQKFSNTRLNKVSEKDETSNDKPKKLETSVYASAGEHAELLSMSHHSTGLTDLLTSRPRSVTGYDSDAKSLQSMTIPANAGIANVSPFIRRSLNTIQSEDIEGSHVPKSSVEHQQDIVSESPSPVKLEPKPCQSSQVSARTTFVAASEVDPGKSLRDAFDENNAESVDNIGEIPITSDLKAVYIHDANGLRKGPLRPKSALQTHASLDERHLSVSDVTKNIDSVVSSTDHDVHESGDKSQRNSLISEIDTSLIACIQHYNSNEAWRHNSQSSSPVESAQPRGLKNGNKPHLLSSNSRDAFIITDVPSGSITRTSTSADTSADASAEQSVHLPDMRISQRLASTSQAAICSASGSKNASSKSLVGCREGDQRSVSDNRYPTFIKMEHNRRPSDPHTRMLFEGKSTAVVRRTKGLGESMYGNEIRKLVIDKVPAMMRDNASSIYDNGSSDRGSAFTTSPATTRQNSLKNANSLAVGGRAFSGPLMSRTTTNNVEQQHKLFRKASSGDTDPSSPTRSSELGTHDLRAGLASGVGATKDRSLSPQQETPTPAPKRRHPPTWTEANENLSEESFAHVYGRRNEGMSEATIDAVHNNGNSASKQNNPFMHDERDLGKHERPSEQREPRWNSYCLEKVSDVTPKANPTERFASSLYGTSASNVSGTTPKTCLRASQQAEPFGIDDDVRTRGEEGDKQHTNSIRSVTHRTPTTGTGSVLTVRRRSASLDGRVYVSDKLRHTTPHRKSLPLLTFAKDDSKTQRLQVRDQKHKLRKKSILGLGRKVSVATMPENKAKPKDSTSRAFGAWASFPYHNRAERNGTASKDDRVEAHDFEQRPFNVALHDLLTAAASRSTASLGIRYQGSWGFLDIARPKLVRRKTKSMYPMTGLEVKARQGRRGLVGQFRKLYRSSSSELKTYTGTHGHRSSFAVGTDLEYPELECLPGEGAYVAGRVAHVTTHADVDGTSGTPEGTSSSVNSQGTQSEAGIKRDATDWVKHYGDCIGSLSALESEADVASPPLPDGMRSLFSLGSALRDSTVNFKEALEKETKMLKASLLARPEADAEGSRSSVSSDINTMDRLMMPGGFT